MPLLNDTEIFTVCHSAFHDLGTPNIIIMGAICLAESNGNTGAVGDNYVSGHQPENSPYRWDDGLAQINSIHGFDRERLLDDPYFNLAAARAIWNRQGFPAWSTFRGGQFRAFLPRMETASQGYTPPPPVLNPPPFGRDDLPALYFSLYGYRGRVTIDPDGFDDDGRRRYSLRLP